MKYIVTIVFLFVLSTTKAQETVYPADAQTNTIALTNAIIHIGNGTVVENGTVILDKGKIIAVGNNINVPSGASITNCLGKHIYPGLIAAQTNLGLNEINSTRSMIDERELGEINSNIRAAIAYNADSKIIGTLRSNGILLANIVPQGGILNGSSSVMQLDAWNWEDALYKTDVGFHCRIPNLTSGRGGRAFMMMGAGAPTDPVKAALERLDNLRKFFTEAAAYFNETKHEHTNLKFEAVKGLFDKTKNFYVHAETVKEIQVGIEFAKEFGFKTVLVGGADSWMIANYLKDNNIAVILAEMHNLPVTQDDDVDQPYKTPNLLQQAGVLFAISDVDENTHGRNLMFNAGTAVAYGLTKEQALQSITLNAAKILGIDATTGSIEKGKDATLIISDGDILDMKSSKLTTAFIQGRNVNLQNKQTLLYDRYKHKYHIN